jgi:hypothetical protein
VANLTVFLERLTKGLAAKALSGLSDRELLERFVARNEEKAFEAIVRRHGPMVLRVCWRVLRQTQDAEDAFQATFLLLARNACSVRKPDSLASWLHGVARRIALSAPSTPACSSGPPNSPHRPRRTANDLASAGHSRHKFGKLDPFMAQ